MNYTFRNAYSTYNYGNLIYIYIKKYLVARSRYKHEVENERENKRVTFDRGVEEQKEREQRGETFSVGRMCEREKAK